MDPSLFQNNRLNSGTDFFDCFYPQSSRLRLFWLLSSTCVYKHTYLSPIAVFGLIEELTSFHCCRRSERTLSFFCVRQVLRLMHTAFVDKACLFPQPYYTRDILCAGYMWYCRVEITAWNNIVAMLLMKIVSSNVFVAQWCILTFQRFYSVENHLKVHFFLALLFNPDTETGRIFFSGNFRNKFQRQLQHL